MADEPSNVAQHCTSGSDQSGVMDQGLDELSAAVLERLRRVPDSVAVNDPQALLFSIVEKVTASRASSTSTVSDSVPEEKTRRYLQSVVQELEPRRREILLLHVNEGLTYKQIATRLGRQPKDVIGELMRAYCTLRQRLR